MWRIWSILWVNGSDNDHVSVIYIYVCRKHLTCAAPENILLEQTNVMWILNRDIITSNSYYCESRWYLGLDGNALVSPFYTRDLNIGINRCKWTGPGFLPFMDISGTPILEERHFIQLPSKLTLHNCMEDKTLMCLPISKYFPTADLYNVMYKLSMIAKPLQKVLDFSLLKKQNKHNYTTLAIILYDTEPKKHNQQNCAQTLQWINKCYNRSSQMCTNDHIYSYKIQSRNISQRKR